MKKRVSKQLIFERFEKLHKKKYGNLDEFTDKEFFVKAKTAAELITAKHRPSTTTFFKSNEYRNAQRKARKEYSQNLEQKYDSQKTKAEKDAGFEVIADRIPVYGSIVPAVRRNNLKYAERKIVSIENDFTDSNKPIVYILKTPTQTRYFEDDRIGFLTAYRSFVRQFYIDSSLICLITMSKSEDRKNIYLLADVEAEDKEGNKANEKDND
jgi:hypothetical protein